MANNKDELAEQIANRIVGVKHRTDDGRTAVVERVNSSHPHLKVGLFVDYKATPDYEWITPQELKSRLDSDEWTVWEDETDD